MRDRAPLPLASFDLQGGTQYLSKDAGGAGIKRARATECLRDKKMGRPGGRPISSFWSGGDYFAFRPFRQANPASPIIPTPRRSRLAGSGTRGRWEPVVRNRAPLFAVASMPPGSLKKPTMYDPIGIPHLLGL